MEAGADTMTLKVVLPREGADTGLTVRLLHQEAADIPKSWSSCSRSTGVAVVDTLFLASRLPCYDELPVPG